MYRSAVSPILPPASLATVPLADPILPLATTVPTTTLVPSVVAPTTAPYLASSVIASPMTYYPSAPLVDRRGLDLYWSDLQTDMRDTTRDIDWLKGEVLEVQRLNEQIQTQLKSQAELREMERIRLAEAARRRAEDERRRIEDVLRSEDEERRRNAALLDQARRYEMARRQAEEEERRRLERLRLEEEMRRRQAYQQPAPPVVQQQPAYVPPAPVRDLSPGIPTCLHFKIQSCSKLPAMDFLTSDPFVSVFWGAPSNPPADTGIKTKTAKSNCNPIWTDEEYWLEVPAGVGEVHFNVWDEDTLSKSDFIGQGVFDCYSRYTAGDDTEALTLKPRANNAEDQKLLAKHKNLGTVTIWYEWIANPNTQPKCKRALPNLQGLPPLPVTLSTQKRGTGGGAPNQRLVDQAIGFASGQLDGRQDDLNNQANKALGSAVGKLPKW